MIERPEAIIIDGRQHAKNIYENLSKQVDFLKRTYNIVPGLAVILVGDDPASEIYVNNKLRRSKELGINSFEHRLPSNISQKHLINKIEHLNNDPKVHGILVQLPLPAHINSNEVINSVAPDKDVDGFHVNNLGKLITNQDGFIPCTPKGCLSLIHSVRKDLTGLHAVIIGRSTIVGKPMAYLLLNQNCTVTIAHSYTTNLAEICQKADILVSAVGKPGLVKADWIKPGAIVIDVGITKIIEDNNNYRILGDVAFEEAKKIAIAITPVPGGVGPMTIASLLENTIKAANKPRHNF